MSKSKIIINITQELSKPSRVRAPKAKKSNTAEKGSQITPEKLRKKISTLQRQLSNQRLENTPKPPKIKRPPKTAQVSQSSGEVRQVRPLDISPSGKQKMALISKILGMT